MKKKLTGIVLAGGRGKRMGELTSQIPKPLLQINGKTLIRYALEFLKIVGAQRIIVIGGYRIDQLKAEIDKYDNSIEVIQSDYNQHTLDGLSYSFPHITDENILVVSSDYVFSNTMASNISENLTDVSVFCSHDLSISTDDVMKVKESSDGKLLDMSKTLKDFESIFSSVFYCQKEYLSVLIESGQELLKKVDRVNTPFEKLILELVNKKVSVYIKDVGKADWLEIDTPEELIIAKRALEK